MLIVSGDFKFFVFCEKLRIIVRFHPAKLVETVIISPR